MGREIVGSDGIPGIANGNGGTLNDGSDGKFTSMLGIESEIVGNPGMPGIGKANGGTVNAGSAGNEMSMDPIVSESDGSAGIPGIGRTNGGIGGSTGKLHALKEVRPIR